MLTLNISKLREINPAHGLSEEEINSKNDLLPEYLENIEKKGVGFYKILDDSAMISRISAFAASIEGKYDDIVVLGIGGSALGTTCLQQSLTHLFKEATPRLHVIDNISPDLIKEITEVISLERTLFVVVTKSGSTPETISQYMYFRDLCNNHQNIGTDKAHEHFVFITDPDKGLLRKIATEENIPSFEVPQNVGGRFSVLTPVGLLPAKLIDIKIEELVEGAKHMRDSFLNSDPKENLPFQLAAAIHQLHKKGKTINVLTPYTHKLIKFADWCKQLIAESTGKKLNNEGEEIFTGITLLNALGATDQHSQSQLFNEGPNDKFHIFIKCAQFPQDQKIPNLYPEEKELEYLKDVSFTKLIHTEMEGTIGSLTQNDRPSVTIEIPKVDATALGELFMLFEGATAFLGELFNINAFDQPGVELSKQLTKKLLYD